MEFSNIICHNVMYKNHNDNDKFNDQSERK